MNSLDVAASAVAVARSRVARASAAVAVTGAVDLALDDDTVAVVAVVVCDEERQNGGDEEENDVHDAKSPRRLEHGAWFVNVQSPRVTGDSEQSQVLAVLSGPSPVGAVRVGDAAKLVDSADECADEEEVDEGDKLGRVLCLRIQEESPDRPCCS